VNDEPQYVTVTFRPLPVAGYWPWNIRVRKLLKLAGRWLRLECVLIEFDLHPRATGADPCESRAKKS
jgi:hypothetical protein